MRSIFVGAADKIHCVYSADICCQLQKHAGLHLQEIYTKEHILSMPPFQETEYIFSTWGMPYFTTEEITNHFPNLKALFYAAGSVQGFARPFLEAGVHVFSAWAANAIPVAEYAVAQITLANKGFFFNCSRYSKGEYAGAKEAFTSACGNYECKIGLLGAGMIGSMVAKRLQLFSTKVLVFDPFLSAEKEKELGVIKSSLEDIFTQCRVISNHLANNNQTKNIITRNLLDRLPPHAVFINTGRGAQVKEDDMIAFLQKRVDCCAVLDVTVEEPLPPAHVFFQMENVFLTTHIAGSSGNEVHRMAEYMLEEYLNFVNGDGVRYEVKLEQLDTMA